MVSGHVDLSNLFVSPGENKYQSFEECDASALLSIIYNIERFPGNVRTQVGKVSKN